MNGMQNAAAAAERPEGAYTGRLRMLSIRANNLPSRLNGVLTNLRGAQPQAPTPAAGAASSTLTTFETYIQEIEAGLEIASQLFSEIETLVG